VVLVAEGGGATSTYKVPIKAGGNGMEVVFNQTPFPSIIEAVVYMQARMFKGKDGAFTH
jgi:hypothetical protein